jgi:multidrug efflux pump subunit AcrA (membrane-fusion protein)
VLTDLNTLLVQAEFDETDAASIKVGAAATVTVNATNAELPATVAEIDPTSTTSSDVVDYGVTLGLGQSASSLKAGQSVSVAVTTGEANDALYVPATAVTTADDRSTVEVVNSAGAEVPTVVTLGVQGTTDDQILTGLTLGEKVVTSTATTSTTNGGFPGGGLFGGGGAARIGGGGGGRG